MKRFMMVMVFAAVGAPACDDDGGKATGDTTSSTADTSPDTSPDTTPDTTADPIELVGVWTSDFGEETITAERWDGFCLQKITSFDNDANAAVLETDGGEGCGAGFGRVVWTEPTDSGFAYCTTAFGQLTAEAAASAPESGIDRGDLQTGCGGFPWSALSPKP